LGPRDQPALQRYLLDGERIVIAVHHHWVKVTEPVLSALAGLAVAVWVDVTVPASLGAAGTAAWWLWFVVLGRTLWKLFEWRHEWFVATDKRLLLTHGLLTRRVAMMPLQKVTDMSYSRSVPGRLFGYGKFVMESAGQDQALREINWLNDPDHTYRAICAEIFGVEDHERVPVDERRAEAIPGRPGGSAPDRWDVPPTGADQGPHGRGGDTGPIPSSQPGDD